MKHIVKYIESSFDGVNCSGEVWYSEHDSQGDATRAVREVNNLHTNKEYDRGAPDYYVIAEHIGVWTTLPLGYKF